MDKAEKNSNSIAESSGVVYSNVGVGETTYEMNKFHAKQGHGFAAERAEHITDLAHGKDAQILGDNNAKDGADRLVNGVEIQSKYCRNGSACIQECFRDGKYRYYSQSGEPMQIEVPSDMYDDAVAAMRRRIENGQVEGVTDPNKADELIRKGHYTYDQVRRIAQAGTVESLTFDAANGMIIGANAMGISATISFATSIWNGEDVSTALQNAALTGFKVGGVSFLTTVISSQIARTTINSTVRLGTDIVVQKLGPRVTASIANSLRNGTNIYGAAAMNNVSKLLAGNVIAGFASLVVLSSGDIINIFRGRISKQQLLKDVTVTGATIVGGSVGWGAGNAIGGVVGGAVGGVLTGGTGTATGAKIGSKIGGFAGSAIGGTVAGGTTQTVMDNVIEDDSIKMMRIVETEFVSICEQYLITENEVYEILPKLKKKLTLKEIRNIYASQNRSLYVQSVIMECVNPVLIKRTFVDCLDEDLMLSGIKELIEDAIDGVGIFDTSEIVPSAAVIQQNLLENSNIREEQVMSIMQPVMKINKTQLKAERCMKSIQRSNENMINKRDDIYHERELYQQELNKIIEK